METSTILLYTLGNNSTFSLGYDHIVTDKVILQLPRRLDMDKVVFIGILQDGFGSVIFGFPIQILHRLIDAGEEMLRTHRKGLSTMQEIQ